MGDFDKPQAGATPDAAANEKKKLMMVGGLGAVLLAVVGYHFLQGGPQVVSASTGGEGTENIQVASQTPAQALEALDSAKDPTAKLLIGGASLPPEYLDVPRDPFRIAEVWKTQLTKVAEPVKTVKPADPAPQMVTPPTTPSAPKVNAEGLKLTGIFQQGKTLYATINGNLVTVGGTIGDARVVEIDSDAVKLRNVNSPSGPVTTLTIQGKK